MDSCFNQNQAEFWIPVLSISFQMFSNSNSFLDQAMQILRQRWGQSFGFQNSQNLVPSDVSHLGNTMRISQYNTDLRWSETLLSQLVGLLFHIFRCEFQPGWYSSSIRKGWSWDTFAIGVKTTHGEPWKDS